MQKVDQEPRLPGVSAALVDWARTIAKALNLNADATDKALALKAPLDNPTFTGDPNAPTPLPADNDTSVINSAWAKFGLSLSLGGTGYIRLPTWLGGGLTVQWGTTVLTLSGGIGLVTFPLTFTTTVYTIVVCNGDTAVGGSTNHATVYNQSTAAFNALFPGAGAAGVRCNWIAFGV